MIVIKKTSTKPLYLHAFEDFAVPIGYILTFDQSILRVITLENDFMNQAESLIYYILVQYQYPQN